MLDLDRLHGIFTPILTPLTDDEDVDHQSVGRLVNYLIDRGVHGIWATGTTGEFPCFDRQEREEILHTVVAAVRGRVPVIAGIGDAGTRLAIANGEAALRAGVDAIALTPPYYYVNSQDELLEHYRAVRRAVDLPLLVYNIPQNVKVKLDVSTVLTLAREGTVVGIKDSQNDLDWFRQVMIGIRGSGVNFRGFLGTRILIDSGVIAGAHGAIPGISNVCAADCVAVYEAARRGDWATADQHSAHVLDVQKVVNIAKGSPTASNFSGMKALLKSLGVVGSARVRLPLRTASVDEEARIAREAAGLGLPAIATPTPARS